jgi:hypothetical protein
MYTAKAQRTLSILQNIYAPDAFAVDPFAWSAELVRLYWSPR